jgi:predicted transcriptional regulator
MTAQITLTEQEGRTLRAIAQQTGRTPDELIREAVEQYIQQLRQAHRRALLQQARGMWQDRTDLPDLEALRGEMDRP